MMYVVTQKHDCLLYLVDRSRVRDRWWTSDVSLARIYQTEQEAKAVMSRLRYGKLKVMNLAENQCVLFRWANEEHT